MTRKTVKVLAALAAGLVLLLLFVERTGKEAAVADGEPLLPELATRAEDITQIDIEMPGDEDAVSIRREDGNWVVSNRDGYPADVAKLRQLVLALAEATIVEEKTANPDNYARLSVADPGEEGAGTEVTLGGEGFSFAAIVGDTAQGGYRYARVPGQTTSYLVDRDPELPSTAGQWLSADLADIAADEIQRVRIEHADGETIVIEKTDREQTDFDVRDIPEGRSLSYATVGNSIARALEDLTLTDVRRDIDDDVGATTTFLTWDGLKITARIAGTEDATFVRFNAAAEGAEGPTDRAEDIDRRIGGWWYQLPGHKTDLFEKRWDDLLSAGEVED